ncbi:MAG: NAD(+)/NADH kinase [Myxococcota bacterium]
MHTIAIVAKPRPEAVKLAADLRGRLRERGLAVLLDESTAERIPRARGSKATAIRKADMVVTLGGDGTLLHAAGLLGGAKVPILGVNVGFLGFLTEITTARMYPLLEAALEGEMEVEERMLLRVFLYRDGKKTAGGLVLNDAVVTKGALARMLELGCSIDDRDVARYRADGLIVATPTGSTAYNLSAGGPIVYPTLRGMLIAPICPHTLSQRPLVVPHTSRVKLTVISQSGNVYLTLDGQRGRPLRTGDVIVAREARRNVYLVRDPDLHFFQVLRQKLGWGGAREEPDLDASSAPDE